MPMGRQCYYEFQRWGYNTYILTLRISFKSKVLHWNTWLWKESLFRAMFKDAQYTWMKINTMLYHLIEFLEIRDETNTTIIFGMIHVGDTHLEAPHNSKTFMSQDVIIWPWKHHDECEPWDNHGNDMVLH